MARAAEGAVRPHVLLITGDPIQRKMAGPAIRVWNMAEQLSELCDVRVVSWQPVARDSQRFELHFVHESDDREMSRHERWADVIVVQGVALRIFPSIRETEKVVVADLYDPFQLEQLEQNKYQEAGAWAEEVEKAVSLLNEQLIRADFFLCASERQRDLWLGGLSSMGRLNPLTYTDDPTFDSLIGIVPFGLPAELPERTGPAIKGVVEGIGEQDRVLLWGGGIYNWFDPVTLVEAMGLLAVDHPEMKLFFLSATHFNPDVPEMQAVADTVLASERLGLTGRSVFFNENWVDYDERVNYLLDADLGVSTHVLHAETRFAFRTRILDYLWAGLPVVASDGDAFADIIGAAGAGRIVPPSDPAALAEAIVDVLATPGSIEAASAEAKALRSRFLWSESLRPLIDFCSDPKPAADRSQLDQRRANAAGTRFARILLLPKGRRRDAALLVYYLRRGGFRLVREKLDERRGRLSVDVADPADS